MCTLYNTGFDFCFLKFLFLSLYMRVTKAILGLSENPLALQLQVINISSFYLLFIILANNLDNFDKKQF